MWLSNPAKQEIETKTVKQVEQIYYENLSLPIRIMYQLLHNDAPNYLKQLFHYVNESSNYDLRDNNINLILPKPRRMTYDVFPSLCQRNKVSFYV